MAESTDQCCLCGVDLIWSKRDRVTKKRLPQTPSLDRINNERFLVFANVRIICMRCNTTKGEYSDAEYIEHCKRVVQRSVFPFNAKISSA